MIDINQNMNKITILCVLGFILSFILYNLNCGIWTMQCVENWNCRFGVYQYLGWLMLIFIATGISAQLCKKKKEVKA